MIAMNGSMLIRSVEMLTPASCRAVAIESEASGVVTELVAILVQKLSAADFARVRDIITSDVVLSNPRLAKNLEQAFRRTMQDCRIHTVKAALRTG